MRGSSRSTAELSSSSSESLRLLAFAGSPSARQSYHDGDFGFRRFVAPHYFSPTLLWHGVSLWPSSPLRPVTRSSFTTLQSSLSAVFEYSAAAARQTSVLF